MEQQLYELPDGWEWKDLLSVTEMSRRSIQPKNGIEYNYIGLEHIEGGTGHLLNYSATQGDLISSSKTAFLKGMVLYGKLRPYLNKVHVALFDGIATTEIIPFRCMDEIYSDYLAAYMRSGYFLDAVMSNCSGARMPRATTQFFKSIAKVPLPPFNEQKRIVAKLDALFTRIDTAITHLQQTLELSKALFASALDEVFSPEKNKGKFVSLNQIATVARGKSKHRPRNDKILFGGDYPFIQTGDVRNADQYIIAYSTTYNEKGLAQSKLWPEGTICLTIAANIGEVAILGIDACFPDSVVGISSDSESNEYIYYFLTTLQQHLDSKATMAAQKNINLRVLSEIKIPLPSLGEQKRIVIHLNALSERTRTLETATQEKLNDLTTLKASLLDAAFKGQL